MIYWADVTEIHAKNDRVQITVEMSAENYADLGYVYPNGLPIQYEVEDDSNLGAIETSGPFFDGDTVYNDFGETLDDGWDIPEPEEPTRCVVCGGVHTY